MTRFPGGPRSPARLPQQVPLFGEPVPVLPFDVEPQGGVLDDHLELEPEPGLDGQLRLFTARNEILVAIDEALEREDLGAAREGYHKLVALFGAAPPDLGF